MDFKKAIEIICDIERQCDVNSVAYRDLKVWPLIRLMVWTQLCHPEKEIIRSPKLTQTATVSDGWRTALRRGKRFWTMGKSAVKQPWHRHEHRKQLHKLKHQGPTDLLFYSAYVDYINFFGKFYNPHLDSMMEFTKPKYKMLKIEICSKFVGITTPRYIDTIFIDPTHCFGSNEKSCKDLDQCSTINHFTELKETVAEYTEGKIILSSQFCIELAQTVKDYELFFYELLSTISPKIVFVICYYSPITMALIRTCNLLGIKSVDLQHGSQGEYHAMYTHWTQLPVEGYDLIPDFFWTWGEKTKSNIEKLLPSECRHRPVVGGNLWVAKCQQDMNLESSEDSREFFKYLKGYRKVILFTLQPMAEPMPVHVVEAMGRSPKDWLWLVRAHPVNKGVLPEIEQLLHQHSIDNFETTSSSEMLLYIILKHVDHHITCSSSSCYESIIFNVPTTIVDANGAQEHKDYISQGILNYSINADDLLSVIENMDKSKTIKEKFPFIETSSLKAAQALDYIISSDGCR